MAGSESDRDSESEPRSSPRPRSARSCPLGFGGIWAQAASGRSLRPLSTSGAQMPAAGGSQPGAGGALANTQWQRGPGRAPLPAAELDLRVDSGIQVQLEATPVAGKSGLPDCHLPGTDRKPPFKFELGSAFRVCPRLSALRVGSPARRSSLLNVNTEGSGPGAGLGTATGSGPGLHPGCRIGPILRVGFQCAHRPAAA
jgi:hypothetical protein